jgi:spore cortex biosynthesis protein YabQ
MEPLSAQLYAFGIVLLAGVSLGVFFDLFRVIRGLLRPGLLSTPLLDLLFWVLLTPILILYLLLANWGELRGYVIIGLVLGFFFYKLLLSGIVTAVLIWLANLVMTVLNLVGTFLLRLVSIPILILSELKFGWIHQGAKPRTLLRFRPKLRWRK